MHSSIDNTLHGNGKAVDKGIVLQIEKALKPVVLIL